MNTSQFLIEDSNLSQSWVKAVDRIIKSGSKELTPLLVTMTDFKEDASVREALDFFLAKDNKGSIQTVSDTIFPEQLSQLYKENREAFYDGYMEILPRIKAIDAKHNSKGTYFQRLIAFEGKAKPVNQLESIIKSLGEKKIKRRSKFQASTFNPLTDHTEGPYQKFPCLQHVTFYITKSNGLVVNSFYAMQYLYERAYGNWLGLINLGKFVARELDIELERFNCYIGVEKLEINKGKAEKIMSKINN